MLEFVAGRVLELGKQVPSGMVRVAWNGGEMLFPEQVAVFKKAFGVPILNLYGGREFSAIACQYKADDPLYVLRPWQFVELVDENGKPVGPGEIGRIICTSTICRGTPSSCSGRFWMDYSGGRQQSMKRFLGQRSKQLRIERGAATTSSGMR